MYIERVGLGDNKRSAQAERSIQRALENQVRGLGFSLIEVLSPCPTIWKMPPVDAQHWVRDVMEKTYPLGVFRDRTKEREPRIRQTDSRSRFLAGIRDLEKKSADDQRSPQTLPGLCTRQEPSPAHSPRPIDLHVRVAGFGGQGVLLLGEVLAEAGLDAGLEVSWLPVLWAGDALAAPRTATCASRARPIDSPLVTAPNVLVAMNEPSLRKFDNSVRPADGSSTTATSFPTIACAKTCMCSPLRSRSIADELGDARAANMVMLGALLEIARCPAAGQHRRRAAPPGQESALVGAGRTRLDAGKGTVPGIAAGGVK